LDITKLSIHELLNLQSSVLEELRTRKIVRTSNNPIGDYTEWLVAKALNLELANNSSAGHDAITTDGIRYQIKGRRVTSGNKSTQLGVLRNLDKNDFDVLVAVIYNDNFEVLHAISIPHDVIRDHAAFRSHTNGHVLLVRDPLLKDSRVNDIRDLLKQVEH